MVKHTQTMKKTVEMLQEEIGTLVSPVIDPLISEGDALLVAIVIIASDGSRRSILYMPQVSEEMTEEQTEEVEQRKSVGQFQAAIQFGKLHTAFSEITSQNLRQAIRNK